VDYLAVQADEEKESSCTQQYDEGVTDDAEAGRLVDESFVPPRTRAGFHRLLLVDAGDGVMASMSVFEDQAGADESVRIAHDWVAENAPGLLPNPPLVIEGSVVATADKYNM
jgi:hypothetical protein